MDYYALIHKNSFLSPNAVLFKNCDDYHNRQNAVLVRLNCQ